MDFRTIINLIESAQQEHPLAALFKANPYQPNAGVRDPLLIPEFVEWFATKADPKQVNRFAYWFGLPDPDDFGYNDPEGKRKAARELVTPQSLPKLPAALWMEFLLTRRTLNSKMDMLMVRPQPLPPDTWLIHFSHDAAALMRGEELRGTGSPDFADLAATFQTHKPTAGYNFAYLADSYEVWNNGRDDFYGTAAIMFQAAGVHVYHSGDADEEVIFYGPDLGDAVYLRRGDVGLPWKVMNGKKVVFKDEDIVTVVRWVLQNLVD